MDFSTKNYEPQDFCIELSRMIHAQEKDGAKFDRLFVELFELTGDDKYVSEWMNKNDPLFIHFMQTVLKLHHIHKVPVRNAIFTCYRVHCSLDKKVLELKEDYGKNHERILFGSPGEDKSKERKGALSRLAGLFRRR